MKNPPITIKHINIDQIDSLMKVARDSFKSAFGSMNTIRNMEDYIKGAFNKSQLSKELNNHDSFFYLIMVKSEIIGYLKLNVGSAQTEMIHPDALEIQRIYLYQEYIGSGYGKAMIKFSQQQAHQLKCPIIWLGVWDQNVASIGFYRKMGFVEFGSHEFPFGDEIQTDLLFKQDCIFI